MGFFCISLLLTVLLIWYNGRRIFSAHTPDAAEITQTGRAYLQVGNNEVYELFQSAWSGADYQPEKDDMGIEDHTIYLINELGQYEVLNEDLSGLEDADEIKEVPTELDAIVHNIQLMCEEQEIPPVPQPWLPPLKERITLEELEEVQPTVAWEAVSINLAKDGHVLLYGSPGTGKTTFLQSAGMDLARKFSPKDLTMYLMDFGTNGLAPLSKLPQVADTMLLDQTEKISKFVRIMEKELNRRKKLLSEFGVGTLELYRQASGQEEPAIVILLDSYEAIKEEAYEAELFKLLVRISREGLSIGVHLLMTAGRQTNLRAQLYSNFKHQLSLPQNEASEVRVIVGATPLAMTMEDIKGRALIKREEVDVIQLALPVSGANDTQVLNNLRQAVASLQEAWTGQRPSAIPMVPEELTEKEFYSRASVQTAYEHGLVPLGLDLETVEPVTWNLAKGNLLYLTDKEELMTALVKHIAKGKQKVIVLAPQFSKLNLERLGEEVIYENEIQNIENRLDLLESEIHKRNQEGLKEHVVTIVLYNITEIIGNLTPVAQKRLEFIFKQGLLAGYASLVITNQSISRNIEAPLRLAKGFKQALISMRLNDQTVVPVAKKPLRETMLENQVHYFVCESTYIKIKALTR